MDCLGSRDELCTCDTCLERKLHMLRQAPPDVQRSILMYLPPDNLDGAVQPAVLPPSGGTGAQPSSPNGGSSSASVGDGVGPSPTVPSSRQLYKLGLFNLPLWPTSSDAELDGAPRPPGPPPSTVSDIVIPPLVQRHIPTIKDCIKYVMANANITGPRKEAALLESIDEILAICERKLADKLTTQ